MQSQYFKNGGTDLKNEHVEAEVRHSSATKAEKTAADEVRDMCTQIDFGEDEISKNSPQSKH